MNCHPLRFLLITILPILLTSFSDSLPAITLGEQCTSSQVTIPNNDSTGISAPLSLTEQGKIKGLGAFIEVQHQHVGELQIQLQHPNGTTITLLDRPGHPADSEGCVGKNFQLHLADHGSLSAENDCQKADPAYELSPTYYKPIGSFGAFNDLDLAGSWQLQVKDLTALNTISGTLVKWCLYYQRTSDAGISPTTGSPLNFGTPIALYMTGTTSFELTAQTGTVDQLIIYSAEVSGTHAAYFQRTEPTNAQFPLAISPGQKATFTVACTPKIAGTLTANLVVSTNVDAVPILTFPLTCEGVAATYTASLTKGSSIDFGETAVNSTLTNNSLVINNNNSAQLQIAASLSGGNKGDFTVSPTSFTLDNGQSQVLNLQCTPKAGGERKTKLVLTTNDPTQLTVEYPLICEGLAPKIVLTPSYTDVVFGSAKPGQSISKTISFTNQGNQDLNVKVSHSLVAGFAMVTIPIEFNLVPGSSDTIGLTCTPQASGESYSATVTLDTNDPQQPKIEYKLTCSATDDTAPLYDSFFIIPGGTLNFGAVAVGGILEDTFWIREVGNADLKVSLDPSNDLETQGFSIVTPTSFPVVLKDHDPEVAVTVRCQPKSGGLHSATLKFLNTDIAGTPVDSVTNYPNPSYTLTCEGLTAGYDSTPSPNGTVDFGSKAIGGSVAKDLEVKETGAVNLTVKLADPAITGEHATAFSVSSTSFPLNIANGGASKKFPVTCIPDHIGLHTAELRLTSTDPNNPTPTYSLRCTGLEAVGPGYSSNPAVNGSLDLGNSPIGQTVRKSLEIQEVGSSVLKIEGGTPQLSGAHATDFGVDTNSAGVATWPLYVPDGSTTAAPIRVEITCTPSALGIRTATLTLGTNDSRYPNPQYTLTCGGDPVVAPTQTTPPAQTTSPIQTVPASVLEPNQLFIQVKGSGTGAVTSTPKLVNCQTQNYSCQYSFATVQQFELLAKPAADSQFDGWGGHTSCANGNPRVAGSVLCIAYFNLLPPEETASPADTVPIDEPLTSTTDDSPTPATLEVEPVAVETGVPQVPVEIDPVPTSPENTSTSPIADDSPAEIGQAVVEPEGNSPISSEEQSMEEVGQLELPEDTEIVDNDPEAQHSQPIETVSELPVQTSSDSAQDLPVNSNVGTVDVATVEESDDEEESVPACPSTGMMDWVCNYQQAAAYDLMVTSQGNISNVILSGTVSNQGWISNAIVQPNTLLTGGTLSGYIENQGILSNFLFRGALLQGGLLEGEITVNNPMGGIIHDVHLAAGTSVVGGQLKGRIEGDPKAPAHLSKLRILPNTYLAHVILAVDVELPKQFTLGPGVQFVKVFGKPGSDEGMVQNPSDQGETQNNEDELETANEESSVSDDFEVEPGNDLNEVGITESAAPQVWLVEEEEDLESLESMADSFEPSSTTGIGLTVEGELVATQADFVPEILSVNGNLGNHALLFPDQAKDLNLQVQLQVDPAHVGNAAELLVMVHYQHRSESLYYSKVGESWWPWEYTMSEAPATKVYSRLPASLTVPIFQGDLSAYQGEFTVFVGYRLTGEQTLFYNGNSPLHFFVNLAPEKCLLYALHDGQLNNSQFLKIDLSEDLAGNLQALGPVYKGHDIESMTLHPANPDVLYAASGDDARIKGEKVSSGIIYTVNRKTGALTKVGVSGFEQVAALSFNPVDKTLWGWGKTSKLKGVGKWSGLILIDAKTGKASPFQQFDINKYDMGDITWSKDGKKLYASSSRENIIWVYDRASQTIEKACENVTEGRIEALDAQPNGILLLGSNSRQNYTSIMAFDPSTCEIVKSQDYRNARYDDIEAIVWPAAECNDQSWLNP